MSTIMLHINKSHPLAGYHEESPHIRTLKGTQTNKCYVLSNRLPIHMFNFMLYWENYTSTDSCTLNLTLHLILVRGISAIQARAHWLSYSYPHVYAVPKGNQKESFKLIWGLGFFLGCGGGQKKSTFSVQL